MKGVFIVLVRNYAGGLVFADDKVLLLKNERDEWVLPREILHNGEQSNEVALKKIREQSGVMAEIVSAAGLTNYECPLVNQQRSFLNRITWYIMKSHNDNVNVKHDKNPVDGSFFKIEDAMKIIKYNTDKSLINLSFKKFKEMKT